MYQVTRWIIAEYLEKRQGEMTIKEITDLAPAASTEEILEGIKEYLNSKQR